MSPQRIQLRRTKGWRKPVGAVVVSRPSKWGNPYTVPSCIEEGFAATKEQARRVCVAEFRTDLTRALHQPWGWSLPIQIRNIADSIEELRGRDLACWCPLDQPCHADVLLELANRPAEPGEEPDHG
jgi:hypothetical protein